MSLHLKLYMMNSQDMNSPRFSTTTEHNLCTTEFFESSKIHNVSHAINYTYFVKNTGLSHSCDAKIQISHNHEDWIDDSTVFTVHPNSTIAIIPMIFAKYSRIVYKSTVLHDNTNIDVTIQIQS